MKHVIKNRWSEEVIFETDAPTIRDAVEKALAEGVNLRGADLMGGDFRDANFRDADFSFIEFDCADFRGANLSGTNFAFGSLFGANLNRARVGGICILKTNLEGADLAGADIVRVATRSDGWTFYVHMREDQLWIKAGAEYLPLRDARQHWKDARLSEETTIILDAAERLAAVRGLI